MTRQSYGSYQATLYTLARIYDVGSQFLGPTTPKLSGYRKYMDDLYGGRTAGWLPVLNYALLGAMITLGGLLLWVVVR